MKNRQLGANGPEVFPIGLGCMGMSGMYGATEEAECVATIQSAVDHGVNLIDTGDFFGQKRRYILIHNLSAILHIYGEAGKGRLFVS